MISIRPVQAQELDTVWALVRRAVVHMNELGNPQWGEDYPTRDFYAGDIARGELYAAQVDGVTYPCSYVELGDPGIPHAVVPISGLRDYPAQELFQLGRKLRYHPAFPKGANINFYELMGPDQIYERTYERGVEDFTYACGTGTGSVVTVLTLQGKVSGKNVRVDMTGGRLTIDAECQDGQVSALFLTGPTNVVARGEVLDEELVL